MDIQYLGHSCFLFTTDSGVKVLTDPYDEGVGYPVPSRQADIVTVSHHHHDHDALQVLPGKPQVVEGEGRHSLLGLEIEGIASFHDEAQGSKRGPNTLFLFTLDGIRVLHCGDLGHTLTAEQLAKIGRVDMVCIPVGGFYTIDAKQAYETVSQLKPKIVFPMHYKLDERNHFPIKGVDPFLGYFTRVKRLKTLKVSPASLPPELEVIVLELAE